MRTKAITLPKRFNVGNLNKHPQFGIMMQLFIDKQAANPERQKKAFGQIARKMDPPVSVLTIRGFWHKHFVPGARKLRAATGLKGLTHPVQDLSHVIQQDYYLDCLDRKRARLEQAMVKALAKEKLDSLARLNASDTKDLELRARLEGRLDSKPFQDNSTRNFFLVVPKDEMDKHPVTVDVVPAIEAPSES